MERSYLFYDIETSGLNKAFDQVLQFAAIRTDADLNEVSRHEILIDLNPDCIPAPQAMITHRVSLDRLAKEGVSEFEGIRQIHRLLNTPGTISVGYNTMGFDNEFLRFSFFRNLLPPYSHQYANHCSRFDIFPITVVYYLFNRDVLTWPEIDGKISMKLENLNAANQFASGMAHDAMVDVVATLELARRLKSSPDMWDYLLQSFDKDTDHQRIAKLTSAFHIQHHQYKQAILVSASFGFAQQFQSTVICLGRHNQYKNQSLWLRLDHIDFAETAPEELSEKMWVVNKKSGDEKILLPTIGRFQKYIDAERQALIDKNLAWIQANVTLFKELSRQMLEYTHPKIPNLDADAALYQMGFLLPHETQLCQSFHNATDTEKVLLINQFSNPVLREQAIRILGRTLPERLSPQLKQEYETYLAMVNGQTHDLVTVDYRGNKRLSPQQALADIESLKADESLDAEQQRLLDELKSYLVASFNTNSPTTTEE